MTAKESDLIGNQVSQPLLRGLLAVQLAHGGDLCLHGSVSRPGSSDLTLPFRVSQITDSFWGLIRGDQIGVIHDDARPAGQPDPLIVGPDELGRDLLHASRS